MMMRNPANLILQVIIGLLILLFSYTAVNKLIDLHEFEKQLFRQNFNEQLVAFLRWAIPVSELTTVFLLVWKKLRWWGLLLSCFLMSLFTTYVALVLTGFSEKMPCSCGGVLKDMGWTLHFWFNLGFLALSIIGLLLIKKSGKKKSTDDA